MTKLLLVFCLLLSFQTYGATLDSYQKFKDNLDNKWDGIEICEQKKMLIAALYDALDSLEQDNDDHDAQQEALFAYNYLRSLNGEKPVASHLAISPQKLNDENYIAWKKCTQSNLFRMYKFTPAEKKAVIIQDILYNLKKLEEDSDIGPDATFTVEDGHGDVGHFTFHLSTMLDPDSFKLTLSLEELAQKATLIENKQVTDNIIFGYNYLNELSGNKSITTLQEVDIDWLKSIFPSRALRLITTISYYSVPAAIVGYMIYRKLPVLQPRIAAAAA